MKSLIAFTKKEFVAQFRSGKIFFLGGIALLVGIMNPAVAKLTPWIIDLLKEALEETGMTITEVTVSALDSWVQFFKNIPMVLIAFVLFQSNIFTKEYGSGTLILSLTKGLERYKVIVSKTIVLTVFWTGFYLLNYIVTYGGNVYFWDNSIANHLTFSAVVWWLFGIFVLSLIVFFSAVAKSNIIVLAGVGGSILVSYTVGLLPKIGNYFPTKLTDGTSLIYGISQPKDYVPAILITAGISVICFAVSIPIFNKKQL